MATRNNNNATHKNSLKELLRMGNGIRDHNQIASQTRVGSPIDGMNSSAKKQTGIFISKRNKEAISMNIPTQFSHHASMMYKQQKSTGTKLRFSQITGLEDETSGIDTLAYQSNKKTLGDCMKISSPRKSTHGQANADAYSHLTSNRETPSKISSPDN